MLNYLSIVSLIAVLCVGVYLYIVDSKIDFLREQIISKNVLKINYENDENEEDDEDEDYEEDDEDEGYNIQIETSEEGSEEGEVFEDRKLYSIEEEKVDSVLEEMYKNDETPEECVEEIVVKKRGRPKKQ